MPKLTEVPKLSDAYITNFKTIERACHNQDLCLVSCRNRTTGKPVAVVAAMQRLGDSEEIELVPLAKLFDGNPYDEVEPPK